MVRVPNVLHRFLPAGVPGSAGVAGVPTDRVADVAAELAPLFAQLAATETRCDEIRAQGRLDAAAAARRASDDIHRITASAQRRAAGERADAMARARSTIRDENEAASAAAQARAEQLRAQAAERIPDYLARVTAAITEMIDAGRRIDAA
jgi:vacuolar-type H+-ATPase subunit H